MNVVKLIYALKFIPEARKLECYPPFWRMGLKVLEVAPDYRKIAVKLPFRWSSKNMHGTMFGGYICAVADPLPALLISHTFEGCEFWTKSNYVDFKRPAKSDLVCKVEISDHAIDEIRKALHQTGRATRTFEFDFRDVKGTVVATVKNTVFFRMRRSTRAEIGAAGREELQS